MVGRRGGGGTVAWAGGEASRTGWRPGTPHGWLNPCNHAEAGRHYQNPVAERRWLPSPSPSVCRQAGENGGLAPPVHRRIDRRQHSATTH